MDGFKVYEAIAAVTAEMSKFGISKDRRNQQQGYSFRGIDDVYNALSPMLAEHKLCILPRIMSRSLVERQTAKGGALFYVTVEAEFDFVSAEDGSKHIIRTFGEAMDSADKATNKAMSAAYKYAAMQAFCIPTEGDNDADSVTHEVVHQPRPSPVLAALLANIPKTSKEHAVAWKEKQKEQIDGLSEKEFGEFRTAWTANLRVLAEQEQSEDDDKSKAEVKPISAAEQKRQLVQIDKDLLDVNSEIGLKKCADGWQKTAAENGWSRDYKLAAKEKFDKRRKEIVEAEAMRGDQDTDDYFPGDVPPRNDIRNHPLNAG